MRKHVVLICAALICLSGAGTQAAEQGRTTLRELPQPTLEGDVSVAQAIEKRRSKRSFTDQPLGLQQFAQVLWAAQGVTGQDGRKRTAPSAGGTYPITVYAVVHADGVRELPAGLYRYVPSKHAIEKVQKNAEGLIAAAGGQKHVAQAPVVLALVADFSRISKKYGEKGPRFAIIEAGHIGQNIYLQAEALGLGTVTVGGFNDEGVREALGAGKGAAPLELMPIGHPK